MTGFCPDIGRAVVLDMQPAVVLDMQPAVVPDMQPAVVPDMQPAVVPDMQLVGRLAVWRLAEQSPRQDVGRHPAVLHVVGGPVPLPFAAGTK